MLIHNHNQGSFIGNLGRDPEIFNDERGKSGVTFTVAVNNQSLESNKLIIAETLWIKVVCRGPIATLAMRELRRTDQVFVVGSLSMQENVKKARTDLVLSCSYLQIIGSSPRRPERKTGAPAESVSDLEWLRPPAN